MENGPFIDDLLIEPDDCPWLMWLSIAMVIYRKALDVFTPSDPFWDNRDNPRIQDLSDYRNFVYSIIPALGSCRHGNATAGADLGMSSRANLKERNLALNRPANECIGFLLWESTSEVENLQRLINFQKKQKNCTNPARFQRSSNLAKKGWYGQWSKNRIIANYQLYPLWNAMISTSQVFPRGCQFFGQGHW